MKGLAPVCIGLHETTLLKVDNILSSHLISDKCVLGPPKLILMAYPMWKYRCDSATENLYIYVCNFYGDRREFLALSSVRQHEHLSSRTEHVA